MNTLTWTAVLAVLDTWTADGRMLVAPDRGGLRVAAQPPLIMKTTTGHAIDNMVGIIQQVAVNQSTGPTDPPTPGRHRHAGRGRRAARQQPAHVAPARGRVDRGRPRHLELHCRRPPRRTESGGALMPRLEWYAPRGRVLRQVHPIRPVDLLRLLQHQVRCATGQEEAARRQITANSAANNLRRKGWD